MLVTAMMREKSGRLYPRGYQEVNNLVKVEGGVCTGLIWSNSGMRGNSFCQWMTVGG